MTADDFQDVQAPQDLRAGDDIPASDASQAGVAQRATQHDATQTDPEIARLAERYERQRAQARDRKRLQRAREQAERLTQRKSEQTGKALKSAIADEAIAGTSEEASTRDNVTEDGHGNAVTRHASRRLLASDIEEGSPSRIMLPPVENRGGQNAFTPEKAHEWQQKLIRHIECGNSLASFVRANPDGPSLGTFSAWKRPDGPYPMFSADFLRAREDGADYLAESIVEIADGVANAGRDDSAKVNAARLAVDARKWVASKLKPAGYADRVENFHQHNHNVTGRVEITDADRAAFLAGLHRRQMIQNAGSLPEAVKMIELQAVDVNQASDDTSKTDPVPSVSPSE